MEDQHIKDALIRCQKSPNPEAFKVLYDHYSEGLYFTCLRYLKHEVDAQDVLQETFITVYNKIKDFRGTGAFGGWISRIAVNKCLQKLKTHKFHITYDHLDEAIEEADQETFEEEDLTSRMMALLHELPTGYRTIINLSILEGYSHKEIAELLDISESTSRSQLTRAKAALKKKLEPQVILKHHG